jgi:hypothetical protein
MTDKRLSHQTVVLRNVPLYVRVDEILSISDRPDCFRPSDRLAGRDSHPLEIVDFSRRTGYFGSPRKRRGFQDDVMNVGTGWP